MAKKLFDIQAKVDSNAAAFCDYLSENLDQEVLRILKRINQHTEIFIFSGVIRNFFLRISEMRDFDVVLEKQIDINKFFSKHLISRNSFGGYKIQVNQTKIDLWYLEETWAIKHQKVFQNIDLSEYIPHTAFFNFSSIVFAYREKKFIYTKHFLRFLRDKKIDVVYKPNANNALCVVNTFYYAEKYKLKISDHLKNYLRTIYKRGNDKYESVQIRHFGKVLYTNEEIDRKLRALTNSKLAPIADYHIQDLYNKAIDFAAEKHLKQKLFKGSKLPYLVHVANVAMEVILAAEKSPNFNLSLAVPVALLHDTLEDTQTTLNELEDAFGESVANGIAALTKRTDVIDLMQDSLNRIKQQPKEIWAVKLADRITNLLPPPATWSAKKIEQYAKEAEHILAELKGGNRYLEARLSSRIKEYYLYLASFK